MRRFDKFFFKAKKEGLRSRAYYKLEEIDKKFKIIKGLKNKHLKVLDIGASPGSWLQYLDKTLENNIIYAVDLLDIKNITKFKNQINFFKGDFTSTEFIKFLKSKNITFDVILSDVAPEFTGNKEVDYYKVYNLNKEVINLSNQFLRKNGDLIFKTFQNEYLKKIKECCCKTFKKTFLYKPSSSKKSSPEIYIICLKKK